jgi:peptide/nickel transport system substrate-binding protein
MPAFEKAFLPPSFNPSPTRIAGFQGNYGQPLLAAASAIEAIDDRQFRIALNSRFPVLEALGTMTSPTPFILPERLSSTASNGSISRRR